MRIPSHSWKAGKNICLDSIFERWGPVLLKFGNLLQSSWIYPQPPSLDGEVGEYTSSQKDSSLYNYPLLCPHMATMSTAPAGLLMVKEAKNSRRTTTHSFILLLVIPCMKTPTEVSQSTLSCHHSTDKASKTMWAISLR